MLMNNELDQGVWTDTKTGLMWSRITIGQHWINGECMGDGKKMEWQQALEECRQLKLAGYTDWRMPTLDEMLTLYVIHKGYSWPEGTIISLDPEGRELYWNSDYWTSTIDMYRSTDPALDGHHFHHYQEGYYPSNIWCIRPTRCLKTSKYATSKIYARAVRTA